MNTVRFIATSLAMLKWLSEAKDSDEFNYHFIFSNDEINLPEIKRTYHCNAMQGSGVIEISKQDILRLTRVLRQLQEQPLTFNFSPNLISIQHITI